MSQSDTKDYRVIVTPHATRGGSRDKLVTALKAVGFRVVADEKDHIRGLIPTDKIEQLAAVPDISLKIDEDFQLDPIETKAT